MSKATKTFRKLAGGVAGLTGLGGLLGNDVATGLAGGLGTKAAVEKLAEVPDAPQLAAPAVMPTPDDDAARAARRRRMLANQQRTGRQSTLLSNVDTLG